jgi:hypothetical protein
MSYIVAHIVFDKSELKSVDIVDENQVFTNNTLKQNINDSNADFYIKLLVEKCNGPSKDCFGLSNGTYYRINFDINVTNGALVNGDFLKMGNQTSNQTSNQTPNNKQNSIKEFNDLIVKALSGLSPEKSVSIKTFKQLIVDALSKNSEEKSVESEENSEEKSVANPVVTQANPVESEAKSVESEANPGAKKLETNPQINNRKIYFIKSTNNP